MDRIGTRLSYAIVALLLIAAAAMFFTQGFPPSGVR
jgi:hypothetical protein